MRRISLFCILLLVLVHGIAMPPHSNVLEAIEARQIMMPDFSVLERGEPTVRAEGSLRAVVLFAEFSDQPRSVSMPFFEDLLNGLSIDFAQKYPGNLSVSSVREFYRHQSRETLDLQFDVYGWFLMPEPYSYYVNNQHGLGAYPQNSQKLVEDVITAADPYVDFSKYDMSGDGRVDYLLVVHTGPGAEFTGDSGDIWSHQWSISSSFTKDGVRFWRYSMQPEYWEVAYDMTIGVYVHELGHLVLGLPDLYDTSGSSYGIGYWGVMASGSWNDRTSDYPNNLSGYGGAPAEFSSWSKLKPGWIDVVPIDETVTEYLLSPGEVLKYTHPTNPREYFLIEWIADSPYNRYLPIYNRIAIYHIDDNKHSNTQPWWPGLDPSRHYMVALRQQDNLWDLEKRVNRGDAGDLYGEGHSFLDSTLPSSHFYDGTPGVMIRSIEFREDGVLLTFGAVEARFVVHSLPILGRSRVYVANPHEESLQITLSSSAPKEIQDAFEQPVPVRLRSGLYAFDLPTDWLAYVLLYGTPLRQEADR